MATSYAHVDHASAISRSLADTLPRVLARDGAEGNARHGRLRDEADRIRHLKRERDAGLRELQEMATAWSDLLSQSEAISAVMTNLWTKGRDGVVVIDRNDLPMSSEGSLSDQHPTSAGPCYAVWHTQTMTQLLMRRKEIRAEASRAQRTIAATQRMIDELDDRIARMECRSTSSPLTSSHLNG